MKTSLIKVVFISVLLLSLLLLILGLGIVPWIKSETQEKRVKNTRSIMSALASSFELGALTEEPYFLEEPIKHLAGETSAQYLVVYNLSGTAIAGSSQEKDLPPLPENVLKAMQTEAKAMVDATGKYTDLYVPIWNRSPSGLALDESQIFFPDRQASKNRLADASVRVAGILRLALPNLPARGIPLPTGVNGVYLILAVLGAALVLFFTIWWSWVKRLDSGRSGRSPRFVLHHLVELGETAAAHQPEHKPVCRGELHPPYAKTAISGTQKTLRRDQPRGRQAGTAQRQGHRLRV
jgi:hypothetical protein